MTKLHGDIFEQPQVLRSVLADFLGPLRGDLDAAARLIHDSRQVILTGIGASWHVAMACQALFRDAGAYVSMMDASELLEAPVVPDGAVVVVISRSGKSVEIVRLAERLCHSHSLIAITNSPEAPLAQAAQAVINAGAPFDHLVSVKMYSVLALEAGLLAAASTGVLSTASSSDLDCALSLVERRMHDWAEKMEDSAWFQDGGAPSYFVARGASRASAHSARLLWEEAAKSPATALSTGGFRHGPQESLVPGFRLGLWLDPSIKRREDLALARDVERLGGRVLLIGGEAHADAASLVIELPPVPRPWQFLVDVIPAQLAAERFSRAIGVNCDAFSVCAPVVESEYGLGVEAEGVPVRGE